MAHDPCKVCGSPVFLRVVYEERRLGESTRRARKERVCISAVCDTNGSNRAIGQVP